MSKISFTASPIGIFDSGYGGLTILDKIRKELPEYDFLYLGDNARTPYGTRSYDVVYKFTLQCVEYLFRQGCHLVILACNTASAKALRTIQQNDLPKIDPLRRVLGVIRPTAEEIGKYTKTNHIGLFGTEGTVKSNSYPLEIQKLFPEIKVVSEACPMWVPLIENNEHLDAGADFFVKKHTKNLMSADSKIDTVILGCTHYPLLKSKIEKELPTNVTVISQGEIVAKSLADYLHRHPEIDEKCSKNGRTRYLTTENPEKFSSSASIFLADDIVAEHVEVE
ncbi:MAG: glutamate racemase [Bacteroidales bacterium]|nr:glutamate racemase [Bacteroidales bacterium]